MQARYKQIHDTRVKEALESDVILNPCKFLSSRSKFWVAKQEQS